MRWRIRNCGIGRSIELLEFIIFVVGSDLDSRIFSNKQERDIFCYFIPDIGIEKVQSRLR